MVEQLGQLRVERDPLSDDVLLLMMDGFIRNQETRALRQFIDALEGEAFKHLILDMRAVEYISSAGIGFLVVLTKEWRERTGGGKVLLFGLHQKQRQVVETLGILPLLNIVEGKDEALASAGLKVKRRSRFLLGVVSDTHGSIELLKKTVEKLVKEFKVKAVAHLGDNYDDMEHLKELSVKKYLVPGVFSDHYTDTAIPNRLFLSLLGWRILLSHTPTPHQNDIEGDIDPEEAVEKRKIDILLYGHTHIPTAEVRNGVLVMNPGNLKEDDKKHPPTYGLLKLTLKQAEVKIFDAESDVVIKQLKHRKT